jgi:hypothetical protein
VNPLKKYTLVRNVLLAMRDLGCISVNTYWVAQLINARRHDEEVGLPQ